MAHEPVHLAAAVGSLAVDEVARRRVDRGDAYYTPPGHVPVIEAGTDIVEFSPTAEHGRTIEVVARNLTALQGA